MYSRKITTAGALLAVLLIAGAAGAALSGPAEDYYAYDGLTPRTTSTMTLTPITVTTAADPYAYDFQAPFNVPETTACSAAPVTVVVQDIHAWDNFESAQDLLVTVCMR